MDIFIKRQKILTRGIDFNAAQCLEIGALTTPILHKNDSHVLYVDRLSTEGLAQQFAWNPEVTPDKLVTVDVIWSERPLRECVDGTFDVLIASHVAEHVPDLIGWLQEAQSVLSPKGEIRLVLPDSRFSFDCHRAPTRLADLLVAWLQKRRTPDPRDVLDFALHKIHDKDARCQDFYDGTAHTKNIPPQFSFDTALDWVKPAIKDLNHYVDVHCWVLTPQILAHLMIPLVENGILNLACSGFEDTAPPGFEFMVFMTPEPDPARCAESWRRMSEQAHDPLPGSSLARAQSTAAQDMNEPPKIISRGIKWIKRYLRQ
ncbi:methyltransferase domain-containing protein [Neokomagataea thailandica]|uniref:Methyltransferase type 11 domain-containing protein n=1 Tax=Neokomagataea tanensis NBRC 106556 TaxID=1223519 RepID=A0ABQ0QL35_9PROT|nr:MULTISPECIES: methyltransferase domain-containing protein [Neokomagataea]GBR48588.1 hypothetical protein AA106556_1837 [Neokomagataea tanensis NBRC 106556]